MAKPDIGRCACPICGGDAAVRESSSQKAYIMCDWCGAQMFARGVKSDGLIRGRMGTAAPHHIGQPAANDDQPKADLQPSPQQQEAAPVTPKVTRRVHTSDGETRTERVEESTIFDHIGRFLK